MPILSSVNTGSSSGFSRNHRIITSAGVGAFQRLVQVASTVVLMPVLLRVLGPAQFGVWGATASLAWLSGLMDIGTGAALLTLVARSSAIGDSGASRRHVAGALSLGSALACLILLAGLGAWKLGVPHAAPLLTFLAVAGLALNVPLGSANNVWTALQKGYIAGLWELVQTLLTTAGLLLAATRTTELWAYVAVVYVSLVMANLGSLIHLLHRHPELRPKELLAPVTAVKEVAGKGMMFFIMGLAGGLSFMLDNLLALALLGPEASARMTIAMRICFAALSVLAVLSQPLWPAFAEAAGRGDRHWIRRVLLRGSALLVGATVTGAILLVVFGERLLRWWLHEDLGISKTLLWAIAIWILAQALIRIPHLLLNGLSIVRFQIGVFSLTTLIALGLKFALSPFLGVTGILVGHNRTNLADYTSRSYLGGVIDLLNYPEP